MYILHLTHDFKKIEIIYGLFYFNLDTYLDNDISNNIGRSHYLVTIVIKCHFLRC